MFAFQVGVRAGAQADALNRRHTARSARGGSVNNCRGLPTSRHRVHAHPVAAGGTIR
jgi:hypothetical protein